MKNKKMKTLIIIAILWFIIGFILMNTVAVKFGPSGGIDSIANALVYVIAWRFMVFVPPVLFLIGSIYMWLYDNHRNVFQIVSAVCVCAVILMILYNSVIKWFVYSPKYVAAQIQSYTDYAANSLNDYERAHWDEKAIISHYVDYRVDHVVEIIIKRPVLNGKVIERYVDAFMDYHTKEISYLAEWDYVPNDAIKGNLEKCKYESIGTMVLKFDDGSYREVKLSSLNEIDMQVVYLFGHRFR